MRKRNSNKPEFIPPRGKADAVDKQTRSFQIPTPEAKDADKDTEATIQARLDHANRFGHDLTQPTIQRQTEPEKEDEEETPIQAQLAPEQTEDKEEEEEKTSIQAKSEMDSLEDKEEEEEVPIQAKLTMGQPDDKEEEEADDVARRVMSMPEDGVREEEEDKVGQVSPKIQAKGGKQGVPAGFEQKLASKRGSGESLSEDTRSFMESRFGADFSDVKVHQEPELASAIQAQAFTHGKDIYFNSGKYAPGTTRGKELLAHELTHVVQQNNTVARSNLSKTDTILSKPSKEQAGQIVFSEDEVGDESSFEDDIRNYQQALIDYFQNCAQMFKQASDSFATEMFEEEGGSPNVASLVLKEAVKLTTDRLIDVAGARLPGVGAVWKISKSISSSIQKSQKTKESHRIKEFINNNTEKVISNLIGRASYLNRKRSLISEQIKKEAVTAKGSKNDKIVQEEVFGMQLRHIQQELTEPSINDYKLALYQSWMRQNYSLDTSGSVTLGKGFLFMHYQVNDDETKVKRDKAILVGPQSRQVKAGIEKILGKEVNTNELDFDVVIQVQKDRYRKSTIYISPGETPKDDPFRYFSRFVKRLPKIRIDKVVTAEQISTESPS